MDDTVLESDRSAPEPSKTSERVGHSNDSGETKHGRDEILAGPPSRTPPPSGCADPIDEIKYRIRHFISEPPNQSTDDDDDLDTLYEYPKWSTPEIRRRYDDWKRGHYAHKIDPRLRDCEPLGGFGMELPEGASFEIQRIEESKSDAFKTGWFVVVQYRVLLPSGEHYDKKAWLIRNNSRDIYSIPALLNYIEGIIGEPLKARLKKYYDECARQSESEMNTLFEGHCDGQGFLDSLPGPVPEIAEKYLKFAVAKLAGHLEFMEYMECIFEPLGDEGKHLLKYLEDRFDQILEVGAEIREGELTDQHLADALRGKEVASGSNRGGKAIGERTRAHAAAWKQNFGRWLQPLIDERTTRSDGRGISRERVAKMAEELWPKDGFEGLPGVPAQKALPSRQTLMDTLKELEGSGAIHRRSPPKGRPNTRNIGVTSPASYPK